MGKKIREFIGVVMSWRVVVIENQAKLDYKMGYMVVRGLESTDFRQGRGNGY